jgi:hypothetical protein
MSAAVVTNLISVNTAPERAKKVIGAMIELVKDRYDIVHAGNAQSEWGRCCSFYRTELIDVHYIPKPSRKSSHYCSRLNLHLEYW